MKFFGIEKDLEQKIDLESTGWLNRLNKNNRLRIIIIYPDSSYIGYYSKLKDYTIKIKRKNYILEPKAILQGKIPTLLYFYNNPFPIKLEYTPTRKFDNWNVIPDAKLLKTIMDTNIVNKMYKSNEFNGKMLLILIIVLTVIILIFLQIFGVVDVYGMITGTANQIK